MGDERDMAGLRCFCKVGVSLLTISRERNFCRHGQPLKRGQTMTVCGVALRRFPVETRRIAHVP